MKALKITVAVLLSLFVCFAFVGCNKTDDTKQIEETVTETGPLPFPWEVEGSKKPADYTWEEFEALLPEHQMAFQNTFADIEEFVAWMEKAEGNAKGEPYPWEIKGAKKPADYTWEEFEALLPEYQMAFQNTFAGIEEFNAWMEKANGNANEELYPWEIKGAKKPADYTWAEFEALLPEYQIAFQLTFDSFEDFDKWLTANEPK